jgi:hypothetical protein
MIRPMDIVYICHEICGNKEKVFDEIREALDFLNLQEAGILEDKANLCKEGRNGFIFIIY